MAVAYPIPDWLKAPSPEAIGQLALGGARLAQQERGMQMEAAQAAQRIGIQRAQLAEAAKENQLRAQIASEKAMRDALMQQTRAQVQAAYNDQRLSNEGKRLEQAQQRIEASAMQVAQKAALGQQAAQVFEELGKRKASGELDDAAYEQLREQAMLNFSAQGLSFPGASSYLSKSKPETQLGSTAPLPQSLADKYEAVRTGPQSIQLKLKAGGEQTPKQMQSEVDWLDKQIGLSEDSEDVDQVYVDGLKDRRKQLRAALVSSGGASSQPSSNDPLGLFQ